MQQFTLCVQKYIYNDLIHKRQFECQLKDWKFKIGMVRYQSVKICFAKVPEQGDILLFLV